MNCENSYYFGRFWVKYHSFSGQKKHEQRGILYNITLTLNKKFEIELQIYVILICGILIGPTRLLDI